MSLFPRHRYRTNSLFGKLAVKYRAGLEHHPFILFGLPFITLMIAGSIFLTPVTAARYEKYDQKVRMLSKDESLGLSKNRRRFDIREEYYRLVRNDQDNWKQKRVPRLPGEPDGIF